MPRRCTESPRGAPARPGRRCRRSSAWRFSSGDYRQLIAAQSCWPISRSARRRANPPRHNTESNLKSEATMAEKRILNFINGEFVASKSGKTFDDRSPVDGSVVGIVSEAGKEEVDAAVDAARAALEGPWSTMDIAKRSELLYAVA